MREFGSTGCGFGVKLTTSPYKRTIFENRLREIIRRITVQPTELWREGFKIGHMECAVTL